MPSRIEGWSREWARLGWEEIRRRVLAEFCNECGVDPMSLCISKSGRVLVDYRHAERYRMAVKRFDRQRRETVVGPE